MSLSHLDIKFRVRHPQPKFINRTSQILVVRAGRSRFSFFIALMCRILNISILPFFDRSRAPKTKSHGFLRYITDRVSTIFLYIIGVGCCFFALHVQLTCFDAVFVKLRTIITDEKRHQRIGPFAFQLNLWRREYG